MTSTQIILVAAVVFLPLGLRLALAAARRARLRARIRRAERRSLELSEAFGLQRRQDPEIPTTWHLSGRIEGLPIQISLGSPNESDFLVVDLRGRCWLPEGVHIRAAGVRPGYHPKDGMWETRDASSGEVGIVIEPKEAIKKWPFLVAQIEQFPHGAWPQEVTRERFWCRARIVSSATMAGTLRELLSTASAWAKSSEVG